MTDARPKLTPAQRKVLENIKAGIPWECGVERRGAVMLEMLALGYCEETPPEDMTVDDYAATEAGRKALEQS